MVGVPALARMSLREKASFYAAVLRFGGFVLFITAKDECPRVGAGIAGLFLRNAGARTHYNACAICVLIFHLTPVM